MFAAAWLSATCAFAQAGQQMMKAIVVHQYGGPEVLKYEDTPRPEPKNNEVLVKIIAAGVNPVDGAIRSGHYPLQKPPFIPGYDVAGVVEKNPGDVNHYKPGDAVYAYIALEQGGGYADYVSLTPDELAPKPSNVSFVDAAGVPLAALTAWQALVDLAQLHSGQTVLIHGGSGGVGSFAIQIAKALGAKVIATASTPNQELLQKLGADVAVDYTKQKFEDVAKDVDVVFDLVGKDTLARSYAVVKKGGFIVTAVAQVNQAELDKHGIRGATVSVKPNAEELARITKYIEGKQVKPFVSQVLPLRDAAKAQEQAATHHTRGKIVLKVADEPK